MTPNHATSATLESDFSVVDAGSRHGTSGRAGLGIALLPAALTLYLAFQSGGFFPGATGLGTLALILVLAGRTLLADQPFSGFGAPLAVAVGALGLFGVLILASSAWSDSSARALPEFDRLLLYLATLLCLGSLPRDSKTARWMISGLAAVMTAICVAALITRTLPDVWSAPPALQRNRLSYPIGYWNALGLMASTAMILCLHLTSSAREPRSVRVLAAAAWPVLGATLFFTFSRGPVLVLVVGVLAYLGLGRPRAGVSGLLAIVPATAIAVIASYDADVLADFVNGRGYRPLTHAGLAEAHHVALTVAVCVVIAGVLRAIALRFLDARLVNMRVRRETRRKLALGVSALAVAAIALGVAVATHEGWPTTQYDRFLHDPVSQTGDYRDRLLNPGLSRTDRWRVALRAFADDPVKGQGAGTYELFWDQHRPTESNTKVAHSLYFETLGELGVVGLALLLIALLGMVGGLVVRVRGGEERALYAALLTCALTWLAHVAIDWDWEVPAVTLWVFAAGGLGLAGADDGRARRPPRTLIRAAVVAGLLVVAITPARLALSEAHLGDSLRSYKSARCDAAVRQARSSLAVLGNLPEPYSIEAYCLAAGGRPAAAVAAMEGAVSRDPRNWEYRYGLALLRANAGLDPRRAAAMAHRLNPRERLTSRAVRSFDTANPGRWRRRARVLGLGPPG